MPFRLGAPNRRYGANELRISSGSRSRCSQHQRNENSFVFSLRIQRRAPSLQCSSVRVGETRSSMARAMTAATNPFSSWPRTPYQFASLNPLTASARNVSVEFDMRSPFLNLRCLKPFRCTLREIGFGRSCSYSLVRGSNSCDVQFPTVINQRPRLPLVKNFQGVIFFVYFRLTCF